MTNLYVPPLSSPSPTHLETKRLWISASLSRLAVLSAAPISQTNRTRNAAATFSNREPGGPILGEDSLPRIFIRRRFELYLLCRNPVTPLGVGASNMVYEYQAHHEQVAAGSGPRGPRHGAGGPAALLLEV